MHVFGAISCRMATIDETYLKLASVPVFRNTIGVTMLGYLDRARIPRLGCSNEYA